jgi:hypothetical protein
MLEVQIEFTKKIKPTLFGIFAVGLAACASPTQYSPTPQRIPPLMEASSDFVPSLTKMVERDWEFIQDETLMQYLDAILKSLCNKTSLQQERRPQISLWSRKKKATQEVAAFRVIAVPGSHIYFSRTLLKSLHNDSEIAAALAFQVAHLERKHVERRLTSADRNSGARVQELTDLYGPSGWLIPAFVEDLAAARDAVSLLYGAGFDPRGMVALWSIHQAHLNKSPWDAGTLSELDSVTRKAIFNFPPLLNPIVRTSEYLAIKKRIERL